MPTHSAVHHSIETIKRSAGQSATARIAYITRSSIVDDRTGVRSSYKDAENELRSIQMVGFNGTPSEFANSLESAEKRKDAQTGRSSIIALPNELPLSAAAAAVKRLQEALHERYGIASISAIHDAKGNRHAHIVEARRDQDGRSVDVLSNKKTSAQELEWRRQTWADIVNEQLREHSPQSISVDPRSLKRRAADGDEIAAHQLPERHLGPARHARNKASELKRLSLKARINLNAELRQSQANLDAAFQAFAAQHTPYVKPRKEGINLVEIGRLAAQKAREQEIKAAKQQAQRRRDGYSR